MGGSARSLSHMMLDASWGGLWPAFAVLGVAAFALPGVRLHRVFGYGGAAYLVLILLLAVGRLHPYRALWQDSGNRMLIHLVPTLMFGLLLAYGPHVGDSVRRFAAGRRRSPGRLAALSLLVSLSFLPFLSGCSDPLVVETSGPHAEWPAYGGDGGGGRYSPITQIDRDNVDHLEVAWTYRTGDVDDGSETLLGTSFQATPIMVGDTLYLCTPRDRVVALDAQTGEERWVFDPEVDTSGM